MASSMFSVALLLGSFVGPSTSHFLLNSPPTIGFDDSLEGTAPCGSFKVDFATDNVTDFHVGGDALAMTSIHPQATWLFRAAVGEAATPENWTTLLPAVQQTGIGDYCEQDVTVPADYAGQKGVISVVQDAPDGILYQCAAVKFVAGKASSLPSSCKNVTGLVANYTSDPALSSLPAAGTATATTTQTALTASATITGSAATSSAASAATTIQACEGLGSLVWLGLLVSGALMGGLML